MQWSRAEAVCSSLVSASVAPLSCPRAQSPPAVDAHDVRPLGGTRGHMATLVEVRNVILALKKQLSIAVAPDPRCAVLRAAAPRYRRPQNANTGGYWAEVGRLGR